jgi:OmpA-OmpF porin, OOP family
MKNAQSRMAAAVLGTLSLTVALLAHAQSGGSESWGESGERRPSWLPFTAHGYVGASVGKTYHDLDGCIGSGPCDDSGLGFKVFTGGRFVRGLGMELGYVHFGDLDRNGGQMKGANLSLVGSLPLAESFSVNAKMGGIYSWTRVSSNLSNTPTGKENDLGLSYGLGAQWDLTQSWALRADWDRYRLKYAGQKDDADMLSVGMQYKF